LTVSTAPVTTCVRATCGSGVSRQGDFADRLPFIALPAPTIALADTLGRQCGITTNGYRVSAARRFLMRFEVESRPTIEDASEQDVRSAISALRSFGPSSFASLTDENGNYLQVGGGGVTCLLERRGRGRAKLRRPARISRSGHPVISAARRFVPRRRFSRELR
jgi:hypothetical protein